MMHLSTEVFLQGRQFRKLYEELVSDMAGHYGLTVNETNVLLFLANNPDYDTARSIAELRDLPKSCVSRAVDSLVRQGFLSSREDEADRRVLHLSICPEALPIVEDAQQTQQTYLSCVFRDFTPEERRTFERLAEKMLRNIAAGAAN